jgi:hypothetical protein
MKRPCDLDVEVYHSRAYGAPGNDFARFAKAL